MCAGPLSLRGSEGGREDVGECGHGLSPTGLGAAAAGNQRGATVGRDPPPQRLHTTLGDICAGGAAAHAGAVPIFVITLGLPGSGTLLCNSLLLLGAE